MLVFPCDSSSLKNCFKLQRKKGEKRMKVEQEKVGTLSTTIFTSDKEVARLCHT